MSYDTHISVADSALRHGIGVEDASAAALDFISSLNLEVGNPSRQIRLGYDMNGRLLEIVVLVFDGRREVVIHAMRARRSIRKVLGDAGR